MPPKMHHQSCCQTWKYLKSPLLIGQTLAFQVTARISLPLVEGTTAKEKEREIEREGVSLFGNCKDKRWWTLICRWMLVLEYLRIASSLIAVAAVTLTLVESTRVSLAFIAVATAREKRVEISFKIC